jgi:hypothetical protein
MRRRVALAALLLALLGSGLALRLCRAPAPAAVAARPVPPPLPPAEPDPPRRTEPDTILRPPPVEGPERLKAYLDALGRALVVRDGRRLRELGGAPPELRPADLPWLEGQLRGDLFVAAGAAHLLAAARPQAAVAALAVVLAESGRPILKDVIVDLLARVGGDGAAAAIVGALRADPEDRIRARCARALALFEGPEAYGALVLALSDGAFDVRRAAAAALRSMKSSDLVRVLIDALLKERDYRLQADLFASVHHAVGGRGDPLRGLPAAAADLPPATRAELERRRDARFEALIQARWPHGFFGPAPDPVPFDPGVGRRIGLTVELGPGITMAEVAHEIFSEPPFDRYREWFYLRDAADAPGEGAYDAVGRALPGVPRNELDGTVYLRFRDPAHFAKGVLGYAKGCEAFVQKVSLLHETGHALGALGDEYPGGTPPPHPNLSADRRVPWAALVRDGHLPPPFLREEGVWVAAETCHMNNNAVGKVDFCSVCQLALIARIVELTGAPLPAK